MINHVDIFNPTAVQITDAGLKRSNFKTISIIEGTSSLELFVTDSNFKEMTSKQASALSKKDKLDLIKQLSDEVGGIYDIDNPEYELQELVYDEDEKKVYSYWDIKK